MPPRILIEPLSRFGRLVYLAEKPSRSNRRRGLFRCDCGQEIEIATHDVRSGHTRSCGCLHTDVLRTPKTHGATTIAVTGGAARSGGTAEYRAWRAMKERCHRRTAVNFRNYGGRGIRVCERWETSFSTFLSDLGPKPSPRHSLDRFPDNDGNYEPGNVRWATWKEQCRNKRTNTTVECRGARRLICEWAEISGVPEESISARLRKGWAVADAIFRPLRYARRSAA